MEERDVWLNTVCQEFVNHPLIMGEAFFVGLAGAVGEDARPGDREAVDFRAQILEQLHIFFIQVIGIVGDIASVSLKSFPRRVGEGVPYGRFSPVFIRGAFDLVGGGGAAPLKVGWESE